MNWSCTIIHADEAGFRVLRGVVSHNRNIAASLQIASSPQTRVVPVSKTQSCPPSVGQVADLHEHFVLQLD